MKTPVTKETAAEVKDLNLNTAAPEVKNEAEAKDPHADVAIAAAEVKEADPGITAAEVKAADPVKKTTTKKTKKEVKDPSLKKVKVKILAANMAGKYLLPFSPGQIAELPQIQAEEIIEAGDGTLATDKDLKA